MKLTLEEVWAVNFTFLIYTYFDFKFELHSNPRFSWFSLKSTFNDSTMIIIIIIIKESLSLFSVNYRMSRFMKDFPCKKLCPVQILLNEQV